LPLPRIWSRGDANANCPPQIFVIGLYLQKAAFCGLYNWPTPKFVFVFGRGSAPDPAGELTTFPQTWGSVVSSQLVGCRGDTPPHTASHSALTHLQRSSCVPRAFQPDLRVCTALVDWFASYLMRKSFPFSVQLRINNCTSNYKLQH